MGTPATAGTMREGRGRPSLQQRVEESRPGRAVLSLVILFTLGAMLVSNLPASALKTAAQPLVNPWLDLTGLHQNWNLFAPDPRRTTLGLEARITYADGTTVRWYPPAGGALIGVYHTFRWRKWAGYVVTSDNKSLWGPTADWIARTHVRDGALPVTVVLVRRSYLAPKPGSADTRTHLFLLRFV